MLLKIELIVLCDV